MLRKPAVLITGLIILAAWFTAPCLGQMYIDKTEGDSIYKSPVVYQNNLPRDISRQQWDQSDDERHREIAAFFVDVADAFGSGQQSAIEATLSRQHLIESAVDKGKLDADEAVELATKESGLDPVTFTWLVTQSWDQHDISEIEFTGDDTARLSVRHWDDNNEYYTYLRWWLVKTADGWKVADVENREYELLASTLFAFASRRSDKGQDWWPDVARFLRGMNDDDGFEEWQMRLEDALENELPVDLQAYLLSLRIAGLLQTEDREGEALEQVDELESIKSCPIVSYQRGKALISMGEYEEGIYSIENYAEKFGWDADTCEIVADAWFALDDLEASAEFAEKGVIDNGRSWGCLASFAVALPADQKSRLDPYFAKMDNDANLMDYVMGYASNVDDMDALLHIYRLLRKYHPDSEITRQYQSQFDQ